MLLSETGTVFLKRLHRREDCGQMAVNSQIGRFTIRRGCDDHFLNQLPQEIEMSLDVILFACAGAHHCCQGFDGGGIHGWVRNKSLRLPTSLFGGSCQAGLKLLTLGLEVVEHLVECFDLRLTIHDALGDLTGDDLLLA
ncbi:hypothetical protein [Agrobacterium sp. Azo12]|uniref:hypothetical protein n=1 Tax=Agrobacterium sp. Azo12 TaxID=3031129 RepID=UPI0023D81684|nr:hypothetical protein [Agrobacterium sp. Azo12]MDO5894042.1 hypothetical protein [Agrobacterium sp. Azo12]